MNPNRKPRGRYRAASPVIAASARRRRGLRMPGIRALLTAVVALSVGVGGAVAAAGGSYAYLNSTATYGSGGTVSSGTAALTLQRGSAAATSALTIPASDYANMLPGDIVGQPIVLRNAGDVPLAVTVNATSDGAWETRVAPGACPATGLLGSAALTPTAVNYATLAAGASSTFCLQVVLPASAPASAMNTSLGYTVTLTGTQVTP